MKNIKVILADDHELLIKGFTEALKKHDIEVVKSLTSTEKLSDEYARLRPDVLVLDVRFDEKNDSGLQACEAILAENPSAKIVMLSQFDQEYIIKKSYQMGAFSFIRKNDELQELINSIHSAYHGEKYFSPAIAKKMAFFSINPPNPIENLSERERQIFISVANGKTQQEISNEQELSMKTVNKVISDIKDKLRLERVTDFTKMGIKYHIISIE